MYETVELTNPTTLPSSPKATGFGDISPRLAGVGAITFAATVFLQNVIRGGSAPTNGASTAKILSHYADHRPIMFVLIATYVLSGFAMAVFLGGAMRRLLASDRRGWALTGLVGATGVMAIFAVVVGAEQALSVVASRGQPNLGAIDAIWAIHNSVFTVLDLSIAIALFGLARAGVAAGITPGAYRKLAPIGTAMLLVGTLAGPSIAAGDAVPLFGITGIGFLIWLSFLVATGVRLVRSTEA